MKAEQKSVVIVSKPARAELAQVVTRLAQWLKAHDFSVIVDRETAEQVAPDGYETIERSQIAERNPAFVIVLGGDGTLLAAARQVASSKIPILGVNLGSLGFLTEVALAELYPMLEAVYEQRCAIEKRAMLQCELVRNGKCVEQFEALNDIVVSKSAIARIADFDFFLDGAFMSNYKADGIIIATPTGSTAYSLAAGGPILAPNVHAFVITPVSPHSLTTRPLVVHDSAVMEIEVKTTEETYLTVDGQVGTPLCSKDRVKCRRSEDEIQLFHFAGKSFFDVLRQKLKWGER
jgi:NAD+ kinase